MNSDRRQCYTCDITVCYSMFPIYLSLPLLWINFIYTCIKHNVTMIQSGELKKERQKIKPSVTSQYHAVFSVYDQKCVHMCLFCTLCSVCMGLCPHLHFCHASQYSCRSISVPLCLFLSLIERCLSSTDYFLVEIITFLSNSVRKRKKHFTATYFSLSAPTVFL